MKFQKLTLLIIGLFLFTGLSYAQEKTAAGVYNEGLGLLKAKNYEDGYKLMEEALKLAEAGENEKVIGLAKKNGATAAYNMANAKRKAGANDEAMTLYERGIELNPDYASNYRGKAMVLEGKGNLDEALTTYLKAGDMYVTDKKDSKAKEIFKKTQNMVGKKYIAKEYETAISLAKVHIEKKPTAEVYYYMGKSQLAMNKMEDALKNIDMAISSSTKAEDKYFDAKATILEKQGKNAEAVAEYKKITGEKYKARAEQKIKTLGTK